MSYITANKTASAPVDPPDSQVQIVTEDVEQAQGAPQGRIDRTLRMAERIVRDLAPRPEEATAEEAEEYRQAASDAEVAVFEYIWDTKGYVRTQRSVVDSSVSYQSNPAVLEIIETTMGGYAKGADGEGEPAAVHNVSKQPLWEDHGL